MKEQSKIAKLLSGKAITIIMWCVVGAICVMICVATLLAGSRDLDDVPALWTASISFDIGGTAIAVFILASTIIDNTQRTKEGLYFIALVVATAITMFLDACFWAVDSIPSMRIVNYIVNLIFYINGDLFCLLYFDFISSQLSLRKKDVQPIKVISYFLCAITIISILLNPLTDFYFTVSPEGVYSRTNYYFVSFFYTAIVMLISIAFILGAKVSVLKKAMLLTYLFLPIVGFAASAILYGLSLGYPMIMCANIVLYSSFFTERGKNLAVNENELKYASGIQMSSLKTKFPEDDRYKLFACINTAKDVGGDFYDFFVTDDDHLIILIADVSGKGMPASLFMMKCQTLLSAEFKHTSNLAEAVTNANAALCENNSRHMFVTAWIASIELSTGKMTYVNAGHNHPVLISGGCSSFIESQPDLFLGGMKRTVYSNHEFQLSKGDYVYLYTDGVTEAQDMTDSQFSDEGLLTVLSRDFESPEEVCNYTLGKVKKFAGKAEQYDDITMLSFKYCS